MKYTVWCPDDGTCQEDGRKVEAGFPEVAAAKWGELYDRDSADYWIARGSARIVNVMDESGVTRAYEVSAESRPTYRARLAQGRTTT